LIMLAHFSWAVHLPPLLLLSGSTQTGTMPQIEWDREMAALLHQQSYLWVRYPSVHPSRKLSVLAGRPQKIRYFFLENTDWKASTILNWIAAVIRLYPYCCFAGTKCIQNPKRTIFCTRAENIILWVFVWFSHADNAGSPIFYSAALMS